MRIMGSRGLRVAIVYTLTACAGRPVQTSPVPTRAVGELLRAGTQLVYGSGGREQAPWVVDSVHLRVAHGGRSDCSRVWLRRAPTAPAELRASCVRGDTLFGWSRVDSTWRAERPVGPNMRLVVPQSSGARLEYATGGAEVRTISGRAIPVLPTTILTVSASGDTTRRLREAYALALGTATAGIFEVPDTAAAGGWRLQQQFELVRLSGIR